MELTLIPSTSQSVEKYSEPILADSKLTKSETIIYQASTKQKIMYLSEKEKLRIANTIISMAKVRLGLKERAKHEDTVETQMILGDLGKFDFLTEDEVMLALKNGLDGNYLKEHESNVFWNPSNFVIWVKKYNLEKSEVMRKVTNAKPVEEKKEVPNDSDLKKQAIETVNMYADQIDKARKEEKSFNFIAGGLSVLWDYLDKLGIQSLSTQERIELWNKYSSIEDIEERKYHCKTQGYIQFINQLVDFDCRLDQEGKIKPTE
jgi:hypothetical protein